MVERLAAGVLLLALTPLLLILALILLIEQGSPVIFSQPRVGLGRKPFILYKFRTMADGRLTGIGKILRTTGLDELPQLYNVARGTMAFIGPRPLTSGDVERLGWTTADHDVRWQARPGLTGPSQLSPVCSAENTWRLDERFVRARSPGYSLSIAVRTAALLVRRKGDRR